jgi:hypothetical protein
MSKIFAIEIPMAYYEHDNYCIYYDKENNFFIDEDGVVVCDIFRIIKPNDLYVFKDRKETLVVRGENGKTVELFYPDSDDYYNT